MSQLSEEIQTGADADENSTRQANVRPAPVDEGQQPPEVRAALNLARRYRLPYVDLLPPDGQSPIDF